LPVRTGTRAGLVVARDERAAVRRELDDKVEFLVLTRWQSLAAIRAFAGADIEKAVVEPNAVAALMAPL
jgi:hypothetical protein